MRCNLGAWCESADSAHLVCLQRLNSRQGNGYDSLSFADGTEAHVYSEDDQNHQFFGTGPVIGFAVESFAIARAALVSAGIPLLYPEPQRGDGRAWQHFRAPDGNVYEIIGPDDIDG